MKYIYATLALLILVFGASAQDASPATDGSTGNVYLAKDDGDGKPGDAVTSFLVTDIPIHCVVELASTVPTTVKMIFVAVDVPGVRPDSKVVTASYTTKKGENQVFFTGRPQQKWYAGRYRADIFVDDKLLTNVPFDIRSTTSDDKNTESFVRPKTSTKAKKVVKKNL